ncbi:beta strand repeat-containing protein [Verrucomicrobiota bacterium sgz303538]
MKASKILVTTIATVLSGTLAHAANYTWDTVSGDGAAITPGSGIWDLSASNQTWNNAGTNVSWTQTNATTALHSAIFGGSDGNYTITLGAALAAQSLTFNNSGYTLTAPSPTTLTLGGSAISIAAGKSATIGSNVTLSRTGAYTITGGGRLIVTGAMTASTGATEIKDGSTLEVPTGGNVTFNGSPVIGANTTAAISQDGNLLVSGGTVTTNNANTNFVIGNLNSGTTNSTVTLNAGSITISSNSADGIRFGSNTPTGGTVNGTLNLDGGTLTTPGIRRYNPSGSSVINATFNFNGGTLKANNTKSTNGSAFIDGAITLNVKAGGAKIDSNGLNIAISQNLVDAGGGGGLEKLGVGTLTLSGTNTYTGGTTISGGTLQIGVGGAVGTLGTGSVVNNGVLAINRTGTFNLSNGISGTGSVTLDGGATYTLGGTNTYTGPTTVSNAARVDLTGTFTSAINISSGIQVGGEGSTTGSLTFGGTHTLFFDPGTAAHLTASSIDASAATITLNPASGVGGTGIIVLEAANGITGAVGTNFLFTGRGNALFNANNTQLLFNSTPGVLKWAGNAVSPTAWDVQSTKNWNNAGTADVFFTGDTVTFDDTAASYSVAVQATSVMPANVTFNNSTTYTITGGAIAGSGALVKNGTGTVIVANDNTYSGGTTINAGTIQLGDGVNAIGSLGTGAVTNNAALVANFGASNASITSDIAGSGTLTQVGDGTVSLTGANSYTGLTTISAGTLQVGNGGTTGSLGNGAVVNNSTLSFNRSNNVTATNAISGTGGLTKSGAGTLTLGSANTYTGLTTITGGAILVTAGSGVLGDTTAGTVVTSGGALQLQGGITVAGEELTLTGEGTNATSSPGALRNISGNNEWTGPISIEPTSSGVSIHRIVSDAGNLKISGNVTLGPDSGDQFVFQGNGSGEISGVISGPMRLTHSVNGTGTWTLSGANTFTGKTTISGGAISVSSLNSVVGGSATSSLGAPATVGSGTIDFGNVSTSARLIYTGTGETTDRVINLAATGTGGGILEQAGSGLLKFTSDLTVTGPSGAKALTLQGTGTGEFAGSIGNGTGSSTVGVTKAGTGTWTLSGANSYTGPTNVTAGTLAIAASGSIAGSTAINVSAGATLDVSALQGGLTLGSGQTLTGGSGTNAGLVTGAIVAAAGSTVAPGTGATTGGLAVSGGFKLESTAHLSLDLSGTAAGTGYDQLLVSGGNIALAGDLTGSTVGFTPAFHDVFYIILNNGAGSTTGTLGGVAEGGSIFIGAQEFRISYTSDFGGAGFAIGGSGNDVALQAIPEPGSAAALLAGLGMLLGFRRRARRF